MFLRWARRLLGSLAVLTLGFVLLLVLASERRDAGRVSAWVDIHAEPTDVFQHLRDPRLLEQWSRIAVADAPRAGEPLSAGTPVRQRIERSGKTLLLEGEVNSVEPPRRLALLLRSAAEDRPGFTRFLQFRLEKQGDVTRMVATGDAQYRGMWQRLSEPLSTPPAQRQLQSDLQRLKTLVERQQAATASSTGADR